MGQQSQQGSGQEDRSQSDTEPALGQARRISSEELFQQQREIEIDHHGRIYRLRLTQMNKLILTA